MDKEQEEKQQFPPQEQHGQPGRQHEMTPQPETERPYLAAGKLRDRVALITGGDSGIGRAVAVHFAKEGADSAVLYLDEHEDAQQTKKEVEEEGRKCLLIAGDITDESFCQKAVQQTVEELGRLDILVNNAAIQYARQSPEEVTREDLERVFATNIFSQFYLVKAAVQHLKEGSSIINTTSVVAYQGHEALLEYSATKGAITTFTRSLALMLAEKGIRVNGVAPGPIWTPLIPASFPEEKVKTFGSDTPLGRAGQPSEVATCYVFLASDDASYITGQVLHPNGGRIVNG